MTLWFRKTRIEIERRYRFPCHHREREMFTDAQGNLWEFVRGSFRRCDLLEDHLGLHSFERRWRSIWWVRRTDEPRALVPPSSSESPGG